ncbi:MAG: serine--tRNA ligase [Saprospiraceae bacterium]|nr:serine--tRNA ligase [Saprospiraceae bacterium]
MLEIHRLRNESAAVRQGLLVRGGRIDGDLVDQIITLDDRRKELQTQEDALLHQIKKHSSEIGALFKSGKASEATDLREQVTRIKSEVADLEQESKQVKEALEEKLLELPNIPHPSVPTGSTEDDNEVVKDWDGDLPQLNDGALPHWELGTKYGILDFGPGVKITGAGFPVFKGAGARLQRALVNFFLDEARSAGYEEVQPPLLVNEATARATGQLPDKEGQMYWVEKDNLYLIPTAEVPVTNILRGETIDHGQLPIKLAGYTPCFRREAGSYGADVKGLNRVHQFDKVEIVQVADPKESYAVLEEMVAHVEGLLNKLELPFRILRLCGGDLGFTSALTYDFEVFSGAQKRWLEVSSVSNFETFQSNRLKLKIRKPDSKPILAHTLNGSALALARIIAALLENNQDATGIKIPAVLQPYTGFSLIQ